MVISPMAQVLMKAVVAAAAGMVVTMATLVQGPSHQQAAISQHNSTGSIVPCCFNCSIALCGGLVLPDIRGRSLSSGSLIYMLLHDQS